MAGFAGKRLAYQLEPSHNRFITEAGALCAQHLQRATRVNTTTTPKCAQLDDMSRHHHAGALLR